MGNCSLAIFHRRILRRRPKRRLLVSGLQGLADELRKRNRYNQVAGNSPATNDQPPAIRQWSSHQPFFESSQPLDLYVQTALF
jgi:hypothetical protein